MVKLIPFVFGAVQIPRAVEEMWRYIALVGTLLSMHGFLKLS